MISNHNKQVSNSSDVVHQPFPPSLTRSMPQHSLAAPTSTPIYSQKMINSLSSKSPTAPQIAELKADLKVIQEKKNEYSKILASESYKEDSDFLNRLKTQHLKDQKLQPEGLSIKAKRIQITENQLRKPENELKQLEQAFCNRYKKLYTATVRLLIEATSDKKVDLITTYQNTLAELTKIWDTSFNTLKSSSSGKTWECFEDNWTYWMTQPTLAEGLSEDFAFGVVYTDGSFDPSYPIFVPPWSTEPTLAIGGWNNSQSTDPQWGTNGFYDLVNGMPEGYPTTYTTMEQTFLNSIDATISSGNGAWKGISLDFENYGEDLAKTPDKYTKLIIDTYNHLKSKYPEVTLKMCVSPNAYNRRYFDIDKLLSDCKDLQFQVMCYDYAMGLAADENGLIPAIPNAPIVGPQGQEVISSDIRTFFLSVDQNKVHLSVPEYGLSYVGITTTGVENVTSAINNNWSLKATGLDYSGSSGNGQITNNEILAKIGDWDSPINGWVKIEDNYKYNSNSSGNIYYYNEDENRLISAYPPSSLNTSMGEFIRQEASNILGIFGWEAIGDSCSNGTVGAGMKTFMDEYEASLTTFSMTTLQKITHTVLKLFSKTIQLLKTIARLIGRTLGISSEMTKLIQQISSSAGGSEKCYIDMGILYGNWVYNNAIIWWPEPVCIDQTMVDEFLEELFTQLKQDGVNELRYSFAQMSDIFNLMNGEAGAWNDTITPIYADGFQVGETDLNFYEYMTTKASENGFINDLSFGGALAGESEMILPAGHTPLECASTLVEFMKSTHTNSVDFDIEAGATSTFATQSNLEFLEELHSQLKAEGKTSSITLVGALTEGPTGPLKSIFDTFDTYFDYVNLMLYSNTQYYLDASNGSWGIEQWLDCVENDPSKISIGFFDQIPYENSTANATQPSPYTVSGLSRGEAAASIYIQLCSKINQDKGTSYTVDSFEAPFFWTDDPTTLPSNEVLEDFYAYLGQEMLTEEDDRNYSKQDLIRIAKKKLSQTPPSAPPYDFPPSYEEATAPSAPPISLLQQNSDPFLTNLNIKKFI